MIMTDEKENLNFEARLRQREVERDERNRIKRAKILKEMRALGVQTITADYDGYGDSGNVDNVEFTPAQSMTQSTDELDDFIFAFVYQQFPGFEINEGAQGDFVWDITTDKIKIEHIQNILQTEETTLEGI